MKKLFLLLLFSVISVGNFLCAGEKWLSPPDKRWMLKLEPALEKAKKENKFVYVLQTGSDWCGWCVKLEKQVLAQKLFSELAKKHLVMVYLDFPSKKVPMPAEQREYNKSIAAKLKFSGGYPQAKILDADGNEIFELRGYQQEKLYISKLYKGLKLPNAPEFPAKTEFSLESSKGKKVNGSVSFIAWGTSPQEVNKPFSSVEEVKLVPGQKIYFKVRYQLPKKFRATLVLYGMDDLKLRRINGKKIEQSGIYLVSAIAPDRVCRWKYISANILPADQSYRAIRVSIDSAILVSESGLSSEEKAARKEKIQAMHDLYRKAKFKIISWGYSAETATKPFSPNTTIRVKRNKQVYFKIRYQLPKKTPCLIFVKCDKLYSYSPSGFEASSGVLTRLISCRTPGKRDKLQVYLMPQGQEQMDNIVQIPCNIIWE